MRWIFLVPLVAFLALFALSNPQDVEIRLWPLDLAWASPLGVAMLLVAALAFVIGALVAWGAALPARRRAARLEQAARLLEGEVAAYKAQEERARREANAGRVAASEVVPARPALTVAARR